MDVQEAIARLERELEHDDTGDIQDELSLLMYERDPDVARVVNAQGVVAQVGVLFALGMTPEEILNRVL